MSAKQNNQVYKGVFEGLDFPPYEYQHYPVLMRHPTLGTKFRATNEEEEAEAKAKGYELPKGVGKPVVITEADLAGKDSEIEALKKALEDAKAALAAAKPPAAQSPASK